MNESTIQKIAEQFGYKLRLPTPPVEVLRASPGANILSSSEKLPPILDRFAQIIFFDFEFCPINGNPSPHCAVFHELQSGAVHRYMREDFPAVLPFGTGADMLWIGYSGTSDLVCLLELGLPLPENYFDAAVESKLQSNTPIGPDCGLPGLYESLDRFQIAHGDPVEKKATQKRYGKPVLDEADRREILDYCQSDVVPCLSQLFLALLPGLDFEKSLERGRYVVETARWSHRGIPIVARDYEKISRNRESIRSDFIQQSPAGEAYEKRKGVYGFSNKKFGAMLEKHEITGWKKVATGSLFSRAEEDIERYAQDHPLLQAYRDLYFDLKDFSKPVFDISPTGRAYSHQIPFGTITGRNSYKGFPLSASKWWRFLIRAPEGFCLINFAYTAMEYGVAAFRSGDPNMIRDYNTDDVHKSVAEQLHITRNSAKTLNYCMQYGGGPGRLAASLGISFDEAQKIYQHHKSTYSRYWAWVEEQFTTFKSTGICQLPGDGWALRFNPTISSQGEGVLTSKNFQIQEFSGAIFRRAVLEMTKAGVEPIATMHDSVLTMVLTAQAKGIEQTGIRIMEDTSRQFLDGNAIRVEAKVYENRFEDKDGKEAWERISKILKNTNEGGCVYGSYRRVDH